MRFSKAVVKCRIPILIIAIALLIPSVLVQLPFVKSSTDTIGIMTVVLETVQICVMIASIFPTERALRKTFDKYGNRK